MYLDKTLQSLSLVSTSRPYLTHIASGLQRTETRTSSITYIEFSD
jgi:hypothetical protein